MSNAENPDDLVERPFPRGTSTSEPETNYSSRKAILRAERGDTIRITVERSLEDHQAPETVTVVQRTETYYGPELLLEDGQRNYRLTAPAPDRGLILWRDVVDEDEFRLGWKRAAEVSVEIDAIGQYEMCDQCGNPLRTLEHERLSRMDRCPGA